MGVRPKPARQGEQPEKYILRRSTLGLSANEARTLHIAGWDKGLSSYGLMRHVPG
jgi:hypothetical protein